MSKNKKEGSWDVPIFQFINEELQVDFSSNRNEIGASELGYGPKKIVIKKIYGIEEPPTMRMLVGKIVHQVVEYKPVRTKIVDHINKLLGIEEDPISRAEKGILYNISLNDEGDEEEDEEKFIRMHPDIITPNYVLEIKTTAMPLKKWARDVAPYWRVQLNQYTGYYKRPIGILMVINLYALLSASKNWDFIMNNFTFTLPFDHNEKQYLKTRNLAKKLFKHIDSEEIDSLPCPIHSWECTHCSKEVMKICGKEVYTCQDYNVEKEKKHGYKMYEYPELLTEKFLKAPLCEACFQRINPHSKYEKWKYVNYKPEKK